MPRRARKRAASSTAGDSLANTVPDVESACGRDKRFEDRQRSLNEREVERRIAAIRAIQVAETENLLSRLRLVRSYINKEQLEAPALKFFQENFSNLSVVRNEKYNIFELEWNDQDSYIMEAYGDEGMLCASLATVPTVGGLQFSVDSVKKNFLEATSLNIHDYVSGELPANKMSGATDALQTPGAMSTRLSVGMTPKTLRLPKNGEMLLSVHGSPLGVYKEENLTAIHESGDGSEGDAS